jgi:hypothetical protein
MRAMVVRQRRTVRKVIRWFHEKWTPELIGRLYTGPLDVAVKVRLTTSD